MARKFPAMDQTVEPSDPAPLQSSSNDLHNHMRNARNRVRMLFRSEDARAFLLAVGIAAFFALTLGYGTYRGEQQTSVPACDGDLCDKPVANATPETGSPVETPNIPAVQNDDQYRRPAPGA